MSRRLFVEQKLPISPSNLVGLIESDESIMVLFERAQIEVPADRDASPLAAELVAPIGAPQSVTIFADLERLESDLWDEYRALKMQLAAAGR